MRFEMLENPLHGPVWNKLLPILGSGIVGKSRILSTRERKYTNVLRLTLSYLGGILVSKGASLGCRDTAHFG